MTEEGFASRRSIVAHYQRRGELAAGILELLAGEGKGPDDIGVRDLNTYDQFHLRGAHSTAEMISLLDPRRGDTLLDLGCGIGGPARQVAAERGVSVTGVDLTESYCRDAVRLSQLVGLARQTRFVCADATRLPFAAACFDCAWTQHAAMNIADKAAFYREIHRVVRPGGRFALHDIAAGPAGPVRYPTPWAARAEDSFLLPPDAQRAVLRQAGFREVLWEDRTESLLSQQKAEREKLAGGPPPPGPHLLFGPQFRDLARNLGISFEEGRACLVVGVFARD